VLFYLEQMNRLEAELLQASCPSLPLDFERTKRFTRQGPQLQSANDQNHMHYFWTSVPKSEASSREREGKAGQEEKGCREPGAKNPRARNP
jgi:hypothetical protein